MRRGDRIVPRLGGTLATVAEAEAHPDALSLGGLLRMARDRGMSAGACLACGAEAGDLDADARAQECETCGASAVWTVAEVLFEVVP